jgi:hypothetical protein
VGKSKAMAEVCFCMVGGCFFSFCGANNRIIYDVVVDMNDLADSIKRLRETLPFTEVVLSKSTEIRDVALSQELALAIQTINQLVELVAEMQGHIKGLCAINKAAGYEKINTEARVMITKADALLTKLGEV